MHLFETEVQQTVTEILTFFSPSWYCVKSTLAAIQHFFCAVYENLECKYQQERLIESPAS